MSMTREQTYKPGNIVYVPYWGQHDLVLEYTTNTGTWMEWAVTVIKCSQEGVPLEGEEPRTHCTPHLGKEVVGTAKVPLPSFKE